MNPPATEQDLAAAEQALGHVLPEEVRELWSVSIGGESLLRRSDHPFGTWRADDAPSDEVTGVATLDRLPPFIENPDALDFRLC